MSTLRPDEKDHRIALLLAKVKEMEAERDRLAAALAETKLEAKEACDLWEGAKKTADTLRTELAEARRERDDVGVFARATDELWARVVAACSRALAGDGDKRSLQQTLRLVIEWAQARQPTAKQSEAARDGLNAPQVGDAARVDPRHHRIFCFLNALSATLDAVDAGTAYDREHFTEWLTEVGLDGDWVAALADAESLKDDALALTSDKPAFRHPAPAKPEREP